MTRSQARLSVKAYSCFICPIAAFKATSRFFGSPTATLLCPGSDPPPASAAGCSRHVTASPPAPGSHPCRHTSFSRRVLGYAHFSCHILHRSPHLHLLQGSDHLRFRVPAPRHACSPFFRKNHTQLCAELGEQVSSPAMPSTQSLSSPGQFVVRTEQFRPSKPCCLSLCLMYARQ